ncbi:MAG: transcriptional regulator NrdR [Patescibacteria group bacterium]
MLCLACHHPDTKVTDSRLAGDGLAVRRRRMCEKCGFRFSTYEEHEILNLTVVKRNGAKEPYAKEKLESGIKKSFQKRPITDENFRMLVSHIEQDIEMLGESEVTTSDVGEIVMKHLKEIDDVAYIRFASVYRSFKDAESFRKELKSLDPRSRAPKKQQRTRKNMPRRKNPRFKKIKK